MSPFVNYSHDRLVQMGYAEAISPIWTRQLSSRFRVKIVPYEHNMNEKINLDNSYDDTTIDSHSEDLGTVNDDY